MEVSTKTLFQSTLLLSLTCKHAQNTSRKCNDRERERERDEQEPYWDLLGTNSDEEREKQCSNQTPFSFPPNLLH